MSSNQRERKGGEGAEEDCDIEIQWVAEVTVSQIASNGREREERGRCGKGGKENRRGERRERERVQGAAEVAVPRAI